MVEAPAREQVSDGIEFGQGAAQFRKRRLAGQKGLIQLTPLARLVAIPHGRPLALEQRDVAAPRQDQALGLDLRLFGEDGLVLAVAKADLDRVARLIGAVLVRRQDGIEADLEAQPRPVRGPAPAGPHDRCEAPFPRDRHGELARRGRTHKFERPVKVGLAHAVSAHEHGQAPQRKANGADGAVTGNVEIGEGHEVNPA